MTRTTSGTHATAPQQCPVTFLKFCVAISTESFWKEATCPHRWEVCACDRPVVKSHFSGILCFIIQMTPRKNTLTPLTRVIPDVNLTPAFPAASSWKSLSLAFSLRGSHWTRCAHARRQKCHQLQYRCDLPPSRCREVRASPPGKGRGHTINLTR